MRHRLRHDLTAAIKARDHVAVAVLRSALAAIENAEATEATEVIGGPQPADSEYIAASTSGLGAAEVERHVLSDSDIHALLLAHVDETSFAAAEYDALGRHDVAGRLRAEADVLRQYLAPDQ